MEGPTAQRLHQTGQQRSRRATLLRRPNCAASACMLVSFCMTRNVTRPSPWTEPFSTCFRLSARLAPGNRMIWFSPSGSTAMMACPVGVSVWDNVADADPILLKDAPPPISPVRPYSTDMVHVTAGASGSNRHVGTFTAKETVKGRGRQGFPPPPADAACYKTMSALIEPRFQIAMSDHPILQAASTAMFRMSLVVEVVEQIWIGFVDTGQNRDRSRWHRPSPASA